MAPDHACFSISRASGMAQALCPWGKPSVLTSTPASNLVLSNPLFICNLRSVCFLLQTKKKMVLSFSIWNLIPRLHHGFQGPARLPRPPTSPLTDLRLHRFLILQGQQFPSLQLWLFARNILILWSPSLPSYISTCLSLFEVIWSVCLPALCVLLQTCGPWGQETHRMNPHLLPPAKHVRQSEGLRQRSHCPGCPPGFMWT